MFDTLFGSPSANYVLLFLARFDEGYPSQIARNFNISQSMVQKQLEKFENAGILSSQLRGRTRIYTWNPRCLYRNELKALLGRAFTLMPAEVIDKYFIMRNRPRRKGKPL